MGQEIMIPIVLFIATAAVLIAHISARHRERMAVIEKGMASDDIKALYAREVRRTPFSSLKWGILFLMTGLAVLIGNYLHAVYYVEEGVIIGLVCLFVGIGLVLFYVVAGKKLAQD